MARSREMSRSDYEEGALGANSIGMLLAGIGLGALLMYLFDPDRGRGRRTRFSDQLTSQFNRMGEAAEAKARDLRNRAQGVLHEAGSLVTRGGSSEGSRQENESATAAASNSTAAG